MQVPTVDRVRENAKKNTQNLRIPSFFTVFPYRKVANSDSKCHLFMTHEKGERHFYQQFVAIIIIVSHFL